MAVFSCFKSIGLAIPDFLYFAGNGLSIFQDNHAGFPGAEDSTGPSLFACQVNFPHNAVFQFRRNHKRPVSPQLIEGRVLPFISYWEEPQNPLMALEQHFVNTAGNGAAALDPTAAVIDEQVGERVV